ncbi:MAG: hypothetical protein KatS3mg114_0774 [Planctomycetaceae bacterium]|nr:MAG: hypothetical protein KatS3mg114_0774 [Planctomycetaceae bacterium]
MNVIIWARVSSREQKEGYSIDAQLRATRERAAKHGWNVIREFSVAESAKRGATRQTFNDMVRWVKANAKRENLRAILSHKLDRVCRNMRDAVRMQELEDQHGVSLAFVDNEFGPGPAGALSFNVMAAVAQYYSDNLRTEVLKGIEERCRQGWQHGLASYGYMNCSDDKNEPIKPHPHNSKAVVRAFELYASGRHTFESLADQLAGEGYTYQPSNPKFHRTALSRILRNRIYVGEIRWGDRYYTGKHRPLVDQRTFTMCQEILDGKVRRTTKQVNMPLSGGLFSCQHCGAMITGERIKRKLKGGGVRVHDYYRCANNYPEADHPSVRWRADDLEDAIHADLETIRIPDDALADWFRTALQVTFRDIGDVQREQRIAQKKRLAEIEAMQERLLNAYLAGTINEATLAARQTQLRDESAAVAATLATCGDLGPEDVRTALGVFEFAQNAAQIWRGSKMDQKREILESVSLNRMLGDVTLVLEKRKPFDELAKRPLVTSSRAGGI